MADRIDAWSFSRLKVFEECKFHAKLAFIDRIPEPPRVLPPGKTEFANDRGTRIHKAAELYVQGGVELIPELRASRAEFERMRELYKEGIVGLEGEWGFDHDWTPVAWKSSNVWARVKLDAFIRTSKTTAVVIDYKTGRKNGNEIKHAEQCQLYQLAAFIRYPDLEEIDTELWYLDQDELTHIHYRKDQGLRFFGSFDRRGNAMTSCEAFPPNPNIYSCRYCPYGPWGTGDCKVGVR